mgnify:CR=1 FL=1
MNIFLKCVFFMLIAKNQHLWEFIYEILMNPMYNPQFLRWENQREGVFRFVQSEAVAQLWGGLKNNENMTYEKLSRAMRWVLISITHRSKDSTKGLYLFIHKITRHAWLDLIHHKASWPFPGVDWLAKCRFS